MKRGNGKQNPGDNVPPGDERKKSFGHPMSVNERNKTTAYDK